MRTAAILMFVLLVVASGAMAGEQAPRKAKPQRASIELRNRLSLYLRALTATPKQLDELRAQDSANGIRLFERNPCMRARLELVAVLSVREREALLNGETYVSLPYAKVPKRIQALMDEALGTSRLEPARRRELRYMLQCKPSDGAEHLMINQVDATGRPRSGGSVIPGVKLEAADNRLSP